MKTLKDDNRLVIAKRLLILLVIILIIFSTINLVWFIGYQQRYNQMAKHLDETYIDGIEEKDMLRYKKETGDYSITMKMPSYLGQGGFISVASSEGYTTKLDEEGNIIEGSDMYITLFIWPQYFQGYKIGLDFYDEDDSIWEQVELTSELELLRADDLDNEYIEYINQLLKEYNDEITKLILVAEEHLKINISTK